MLKGSPGSPARIVATRWSAFARTDATDEGDRACAIYADGVPPPAITSMAIWRRCPVSPADRLSAVSAG